MMNEEEITEIADTLREEVNTTLRMSRALASITTSIDYAQQTIRIEIKIQ